ncbi:MAG: TetR/AcrR family transcriptional regulator [Hyphomonadaceae bacterium]|nr:TetR/AcrR family transcriptional regulator [Hyphomonadaceae bacterium]
MTKRRRAPEPVQARALATRESLIEACAALLGDVGVERLSTNLICAEAGVTPPAFYRYFRDKYEILGELGGRLMAAQNAVIEALIADRSAEVSELRLQSVIAETIEVTRASSGGPWVLRALRAVPSLQHVRLNSHRRMAKALVRYAGRRGARAELQARLMIDLGYAAIELAFDEPAMRPQAIAAEAARTLVVLAGDLLPRTKSAQPRD